MASKDLLREYLEEPIDNSWVNEVAMTMVDIAKKMGTTSPTVASDLEKVMKKFYYSIAKDPDYKGMDAFERVIEIGRMIESLGGNVDMIKLLKHLPIEIQNQVKKDAKDHME